MSGKIHGKQLFLPPGTQPVLLSEKQVFKFDGHEFEVPPPQLFGTAVSLLYLAKRARSGCLDAQELIQSMGIVVRDVRGEPYYPCANQGPTTVEPESNNAR